MEKPWFLTLWCVIAAFGSYACMYGFRKPFTAGSYTGAELFPHLKTWLVTAQVLGYTLSKFIGIKVVSEMPPARRAPAFLALIACAELALVCFALTPPPFNAAWLFLNGLSLGLVFGLAIHDFQEFFTGVRHGRFYVCAVAPLSWRRAGVRSGSRTYRLRPAVQHPRLCSRCRMMSQSVRAARCRTGSDSEKAQVAQDIQADDVQHERHHHRQTDPGRHRTRHCW